MRFSREIITPPKVKFGTAAKRTYPHLAHEKTGAELIIHLFVNFRTMSCSFMWNKEITKMFKTKIFILLYLSLILIMTLDT